jgi:fumarylacetoacetase
MLDFSIDNIPFGIFSTPKTNKRLATIVGSTVVDLLWVAKSGYLDDLEIPASIFAQPYLNDFIALGKDKTNAVRERLQEVLVNIHLMPPPACFAVQMVQMHMPIKIGDYTDFYSSEPHATNVGKMFRDPSNALLPNWKHLPVAYHGRASSIFVSGTNFHRPKGQVRPNDNEPPIFRPTKGLDIELEMATVIGKANPIGDSIDVNQAENYVFGFMLFNDWSARDIQKWEYVPLGPFLAKNFFSSVSPWVVTIEALEPFKVPAEPQDPAVLPYLQQNNRYNFDVQLEVTLIPAPTANTPKPEATTICRSNFKHLYWTVSQQIAHHTVNGCNLNVGDVLASGTISGRAADSFGSLLELTWGGKTPIVLPDGSTRTFLEDGDTIIIKGFAQKDNISINFGEVINKILPAK